MLYVAVFLVLIVVILVVFLVRLSRNRWAKHKAAHDPSILPSQVQDISSQRPTFTGVARDISAHLAAPVPHGQGQPRDGYVRDYRRDVGGVTRIQSRGSVTSLPAYGADSMPVPPEAAYNPTRQTTVVPLFADAPPKYTASTNQAGVVV